MALRLRGVADPAVRSVVAFSGTDDGVPGNRGEIIGHIELGPPGGFSPLTNVCDWELLSVYSSCRGKGIAAQLIRYALAVALGPAQVQEKLGVHLNRSLESAQQSRNGTTQPAGTTRSDAKHALGVITINENVVGRSFYTKLGGKLTETYTVTLLDEKIGCVAFVWDWEGIHRLML
ncbi:hypothetical protein BCV69DRAFT_313847 [Microstroma glucosiphilum]|uniref:N-acetyltransferase domain-containing protein n=1 Tax=Pseudomicrostroma glucosiphilum TaxID=1684307 RepID=A0A316U473_9BASI|nr:hypothetical protein BCV69DRAFT_313847 [Pseudomicrostroma glucosiphilum]PWN19608.1 hypothetical protein BCV69DRAFT_313847 [Pseudomicrostroma glucosiphilum]